MGYKRHKGIYDVKEITANYGTAKRTKRGRPLQSQARTVAVQDLRREYQNLKRRIQNIEKKYGKTVPAVEQYYEKGLDKLSTKGKSIEKLGELRKDIDYLSGLSTSTLKGAENFIQHIEPIISLYDDPFTRGVYDTIMTMYNRMVEEVGILEKFKYQILDMVSELVMEDVDKEKIADTVRQYYREIYENDGVGNYEFQYGGKVRRIK